MANAFNTFLVIIMVSLFYSAGITIFTYSVPNPVEGYISSFSTPSSLGLEEVSTTVDDSLTSQSNLPVVEVGALVLFSGNILLDLLGNFVFAIPQMLALLVKGITSLFNADPIIWQTVELFATVIVSVMYVIGLIQLVVGIRSGRVV